MLQTDARKKARPAWAARHSGWAWVIAITLGLLTAYALVLFDSQEAPMGGLTGLRSSAGLFLAPVAAAGAAVWYRRTILTKPFVVTAGIVSTLLTLFSITGLSFASHGDACHWSSCSSQAAWSELLPAAAFGYLALYYAAVAALIRLTDRLAARPERPSARAASPVSPAGTSTKPSAPSIWRSSLAGLRRAWAGAKRFVPAHPFATAAVVIAVCWIPYLVIFFPGTYAFDGFRQLNEFYGYLDRTTHHPYFATAVMGGLFSVGKVFGINGALFVYTLVQATVGCLVFALTCGRVFRLTAAASGGRQVLTISAYGPTLAFFALNPVFPIGATVIFKDYPYMLSVLVLVNVLVGAALRRSMDSKAVALFAAGSVGAAGFRNDGIVIVLACGVCLLLLTRGQRLRVVVTTGLVAVGLVFVNTVVFPAMGVTKYSSAEMLSVPLQQTARYLKVHPEDVTEGERATLQSLLKDGRKVDDLAKKYDPKLSDPVKNRFESFDGEGLRQYLGVWWAMFKRHPATYVEATTANTIGYFYPERKTNSPPIQYPGNILEDDYWEGMEAQLSQPGAGLEPHYPSALTPARAGTVAAAKWLLRTPVVGLIFNPAFYTWILLVAAALLIRRKQWPTWLPFVPAALVFLVCLASPVNGNLRYALPYVAVVPLLAAYTLYVLAASSTGQAPSWLARDRALPGTVRPARRRRSAALAGTRQDGPAGSAGR
ncbi:MAG: DUF6020 family protein [Bifidobacteriaceae bacterium]|jgi:hypothetical protein|nr:DUF6020 family protein [Bifidobacteriaceae bacterium]